MLVLDFRVEGAMTWAVGYPPSLRSPMYSLLSQNPNGDFYREGHRIKCTESVLRSNGYSSYTLNVSLADDVTTLYDTFYVTILGLPSKPKY
ncbi:hypothetical protein DPMN_173523 [Dreissena polymorpha]|uniref:Uncharacterized protein n=1 Tax=Dreissena polymorpha TaxID=45954 RepID=A0A9D4E2U9_DREPO|nr:hypothetical protein DPMN_173523 [Dreissena polymorpha]